MTLQVSIEPELEKKLRYRCWQQWIVETGEIVRKTLPPGQFVDDSRESIYEDRG